MNSFYVGVDVGTGSVRAALVDQAGTIKRTAEESICINNPKADHYEQSSDEIWTKCCKLIKLVTKDTPKNEIKGIGFDATCSLVVLNEAFHPVNVTEESAENVKCFDIIMWMDHRAKHEADHINSFPHDVLQYVGGRVSVEMQPPKLKWLKEHLPINWKKASQFFDLSDFLTFKATGSLSRSLCTVTCKWLYCNQAWSTEFWKKIGLEDLTVDQFSKLGNTVVEPGQPLKTGLTDIAAAQMNLNPKTPVASALIDAHCGGVGTVGGNVAGLNLSCENEPITERIAFICGTSSCHMAIDHVIKSHPAYSELREAANSRNKNIYDHLNSLVGDLARRSGCEHADFLTSAIHVTPDYHGNRSPLADSSLCGAVCGLTLDTSLDDLARKYLATLQALACGSRHIVETLVNSGHRISTVFMCGGLSKNKLFVQIHANVLDRPIVLNQETEAVLLGAAILGACASGDFPSLEVAMRAMSKPAKVFHPVGGTRSFYEKKFAVFQAMTKHQLEYRAIMEGGRS